MTREGRSSRVQRKNPGLVENVPGLQAPDGVRAARASDRGRGGRRRKARPWGRIWRRTPVRACARAVVRALAFPKWRRVPRQDCRRAAAGVKNRAGKVKLNVVKEKGGAFGEDGLTTECDGSRKPVHATCRGRGQTWSWLAGVTTRRLAAAPRSREGAAPLRSTDHGAKADLSSQARTTTKEGKGEGFGKEGLTGGFTIALVRFGLAVVTRGGGLGAGSDEEGRAQVVRSVERGDDEGGLPCEQGWGNRGIRDGRAGTAATGLAWSRIGLASRSWSWSWCLLVRRGDAVVGTVSASGHHGHGGLGLGKEAESKEGSVAADRREMARARASRLGLALIAPALGFARAGSVQGMAEIVGVACSQTRGHHPWHGQVRGSGSFWRPPEGSRRWSAQSWARPRFAERGATWRGPCFCQGLGAGPLADGRQGRSDGKEERAIRCEEGGDGVVLTEATEGNGNIGVFG
ncbi:unnamed protein product [Miscanthus lutarioriparius]|uniref:Uncharacterized protein n=1 Tax=Miscanthus lutarioriparius TaxID=422564 RepID=A0A811MYF0_9POAL|nr:unnamed protein product [Miscanthus lutarioriparius]